MVRTHAVVLSGGAGTRLWPASRASYPKQLLPLIGTRTMLQETVARATSLDVAENVTVVCNEEHRFLVAGQLHEISVAAKIILEPVGRNTAPAVALAALRAIEDSESSSSPPLLLVMPADHVITDRAKFAEAVAAGTKSASNGRLVCFGVRPTFPATGYGYIESDSRSLVAAPIDSFVEKPDRETAASLLETNRFLWNAGIFLMRADVFLAEVECFAPRILEACRASMEKATADADFLRPDRAEFEKSPSKSIDYAVMEQTNLGDVVPLDADWSDVGSWTALHDARARDADGNTFAGDVVVHDCKNSFVMSSSRLVTAVGVEELIIVESKDAVMVTRRNVSQDVKQLVDQLRESGRAEVQTHRQVSRPWGSYDSIDSDEGFQVKRLIVNPGAVLSLQKHARRAEHWVVVRGTARITRNDEVFDLGVNESTFIPVGAVHRIANPGDEAVHIIEVQCGDYLGEDDIVRLDDDYGRSGTTA